MPLIGVVGYYGYGNLGDEWFLRTFRQVFEGSAEVQALHPSDDVSCYDALIVGGGDLMTPRLNNHYWRPEMLTRPLWIHAIGVPAKPGAEAAETYREFCARARSVTVRDALSRENLEKVGIAGVGLCPDVAWGSLLPSARRLSRYDIGISVRRARLLDLDAVVEMLTDYVIEGRSVLVIPLQSPAPVGADEHPLHVDLQKRVRARAGERAPALQPIVDIVAPDADIEHRLMAIRSCSAYVTMRFHGLVAGLRSGIRTTSWCLPNAVKFKALAELLDLPSLRIHRIQDTRAALEPIPPSPATLEHESREGLAWLRDQVLLAHHV